MTLRSTLLSMLAIINGLAFSVCISAESQADISGVRLWRAPNATRLVLDLSGPISYKVFALKSPDRVVVDIDDAALKADPKSLELKDTPIKSVRFGKRDSAGLRMVLDMHKTVGLEWFTLKKHGDKSDRLVIDLQDLAPATKPQKPKTESITTLIPEQRDVVVAVDAGHGGEDPGASGSRLREKDVVLLISKNLVNLLNREPGYKAYLVRTGDYYIPLRKRRNKARELRADLFVSIHADAFKDSRAKGASVFALSRRGATSESARFLASKENEADLIGGVGGVDLKDVDNVLAGVLVDLSMTATLSNSLDAGARVLKEMGAITRLHKKQVEQAGFAVLKSPDVPSILVETGFISNPGEAKKLGSRAFRSKMANAIFRGIKSYFKEAAPTGSRLAKRQGSGSGVGAAATPRSATSGSSHKSGKVHTVKPGDTLSGIAKQYNVGLSSLLRHNGVKAASVIKVGQRFSIPQT